LRTLSRRASTGPSHVGFPTAQLKDDAMSTSASQSSAASESTRNPFEPWSVRDGSLGSGSCLSFPGVMRLSQIVSPSLIVTEMRFLFVRLASSVQSREGRCRMT